MTLLDTSVEINGPDDILKLQFVEPDDMERFEKKLGYVLEVVEEEESKDAEQR